MVLNWLDAGEAQLAGGMQRGRAAGPLAEQAKRSELRWCCTTTHILRTALAFRFTELSKVRCGFRMPSEVSSQANDLVRDFEVFSIYAKDRLNARAFDITSGEENVSLFRDSLFSAIAHTTLRRPPRNAAGEELKLTAGYLDKMIPNAIADSLKGRHFIGMNTALFVAVHEFAMYCFTQRDFFPDVGDVSLEQSPKPIDKRVPGLWLLDYTKHGGHVEDRHSETVTPRGESRYVASIYLGMLMARFVWLHEFQHCFQGHVRFVQDTRRALYLNEIEEPLDAVGFAKPKRKAVRDEVLRGLELEADQNAFWACCRIQLDNRENVEGIAALDLGLRLRLALFSSYAMTWLFEEFQNYLDAREGITHPAPYLRLQHLVRTASNHVQPLHSEFADANAFACRQFDKLQRSIPSLYRTEDIDRGARDPAVKVEIDQLLAHVEEHRSALERLRYNEPMVKL